MASSADSAADRVAARCRRAAWSTTTETRMAIRMYRMSTTRCVGSAMVMVYSGLMKKKSSVSPESSAAKTAGKSPPTSATMTTSSW